MDFVAKSAVNPSGDDPGTKKVFLINFVKIFIFTLLCGALKDFMKELKALIKPFEAPQRSATTEI